LEIEKASLTNHRSMSNTGFEPVIIEGSFFIAKQKK
jgi:hypothetical protein